MQLSILQRIRTIVYRAFCPASFCSLPVVPPISFPFVRPTGPHGRLCIPLPEEKTQAGHSSQFETQ